MSYGFSRTRRGLRVSGCAVACPRRRPPGSPARPPARRRRRPAATATGRRPGLSSSSRPLLRGASRPIPGNTIRRRPAAPVVMHHTPGGCGRIPLMGAPHLPGPSRHDAGRPRGPAGDAAVLLGALRQPLQPPALLRRGSGPRRPAGPRGGGGADRGHAARHRLHLRRHRVQQPRHPRGRPRRRPRPPGGDGDRARRGPRAVPQPRARGLRGDARAGGRERRSSPWTRSRPRCGRTPSSSP